VAIDDYADKAVPRLEGCINDADLIRDLLIRRHGFAERDIRILKNQQTTRAEILRQFDDWLINSTRAGDRVFFHYSGHGAWAPDEDRDEKDGLDEAIAPYDVNPITGEDLILDDEFETFISRLAGRKAVVLFDACFSGTDSRGSSMRLDELGNRHMRYLPSPQELKAGKSLTRGFGATAARGETLKDDGVIDKRQMALLCGVIVMSAAGSERLAYPIEIGGRPYGALTHAFVEEQLRGTPAFNALENSIVRRLADYHREGLLADTQRPDFTLSDDQLGAYPLFPDETLAVTLANKLSNRTVTLTPRDSAGRTRAQFRLGEEAFYDIVVGQPGFFYLIVFSSQDKASVLFPFTDPDARKQLNTDNYLASGRHRLPRGDKGYPVQEPFGKDVVVGVITSLPLDLGHKVYFDSWREVLSRLPLKAVEETTARMRGQGIPGTRRGPVDWKAAIVVTHSEKTWR
jgi:hypothetical protein